MLTAASTRASLGSLPFAAPRALRKQPEKAEPKSDSGFSYLPAPPSCEDEEVGGGQYGEEKGNRTGKAHLLREVDLGLSSLSGVGSSSSPGADSLRRARRSARTRRETCERENEEKNERKT